MTKAYIDAPRTTTAGQFNKRCVLPYGLNIRHIEKSMAEFLMAIKLVNKSLSKIKLEPLEVLLMPASFSGMVGEFMSRSIPRFCKTVVKNTYHNGHPDMIPAKTFKGDSVQYAKSGIEIKASRYDRGWQGHNPEEVFILIFIFEKEGLEDLIFLKKKKNFRFKMVLGAKLKLSDWKYSGRAPGSRRTPTASITHQGREKLLKNWIYLAPGIAVPLADLPRKPLTKAKSAGVL